MCVYVNMDILSSANSAIVYWIGSKWQTSYFHVQYVQVNGISARIISNSVSKSLFGVAISQWYVVARISSRHSDIRRQARLYRSPSSLYFHLCVQRLAIHFFRKGNKIKARWWLLFNNGLNCQSTVSTVVIRLLPETPVINQLDEPSTQNKIMVDIILMNPEEVPENEVFVTEILQRGARWFWGYSLTFCGWESKFHKNGWMPFTFLYEKDPNDICSNNLGITLLSLIGKIFAIIFHPRLLAYVTQSILPESQCGFRPNRSTTDMIIASTSSRVVQKASTSSLAVLHWFHYGKWQRG